MSVEYAVLGLLSLEPLTGYDMKKIIQDSPFMPWSGNNNQIYKALTALLEAGLVENQLVVQTSSPSKKVYTITDRGRNHLREWTFSETEQMELKKPFLLKLAWAHQLSTKELIRLVEDYETQIKLELAGHEQKCAGGYYRPAGDEKKSLLWQAIYENVTAGYQAELTWAQGLKATLINSGLLEAEAQQEEPVTPASTAAPNRKEREPMQYKVILKGDLKYINFYSAKTPLSREGDFGDIMSACTENETNRVIFQQEALSEDFFQLKTGLAGAILQKLTMYNIKTAVVMPAETSGRYQEMMLESNKGKSFRSFPTLAEAEDWLANVK